MSQDRHHQKRVREIFGRAHELEGEARETFLDSVCGADRSLRGEVEGLLASLEQAEAGDPTSVSDERKKERKKEGRKEGRKDEKQPNQRDEEPADEQPGTVLGPYKLLQRIGEGGMGSVFLAEQHEPVRRRVALKIVRKGLDSKQVIARFEAERQALALMDHPNIARVLDAGATENGRPFFVMELVKGIPITEYCDEHNLTIQERLELFVPVCQAVQHAHQKGVIHRDIKPTNALVMQSDGRAIPKVIDFGIAKATTTQLTDKTLFTEFRALMGTPEYMSPEQAQGNLDIDTRADVYGLGVLLYELLVGTTPFDPKRLRSAALQELLRILKEDEPPKPSTRASAETKESTTIAAHRQTGPRRLGTLMRGELDWLVMKCLEKDRSRRYETANALALDIQRYLNHEPVLASPPRAIYRLQKFVRRNRGKVAAAVVVFLTLVAGIVGTGYGLVEAKDEARKARDAEGKAKENESKAELASKKARRLQAEADARADRARRELYCSQTGLAMAAFRAGSTPRMIELLDGTDPELRGWEYGYLRWLTNRAIMLREAVAPEPEKRNHPMSKVPVYFASQEAISPDGRRVALATPDGRVQVFALGPLSKLLEFRAYPPGVAGYSQLTRGPLAYGPLGTVLFTPDGSRLVTLGAGRHPAKVWDARTGDLQQTLERSGGMGSGYSGFDGAGRFLVQTDGDLPQIWDLATGKLRCRLASPGTPGAHYGRVLLSRDATRAFATTQDGVLMWDASSGRHLGRFADDGFQALKLTLAPDDRSILVSGVSGRWVGGLRTVSAGESMDARLYDYGEGRLVRSFQAVSSVWIHTYVRKSRTSAFSPDGRQVAWLGGPVVKVFDVQSGRRIRTLGLGQQVYEDIAFAADGRSIRLRRTRDGQDQGRALIWAECDLSTPEDVFTIHTPVRLGERLSFVLDGRQIAVLRSQRLWSNAPSMTFDARDGSASQVLSKTSACAVSGNGRRCAEVKGMKPGESNVALVEVRDLASQKVVATIAAPGGWGSALALSPDGRRIAVGTSVRRSGSTVSTTRIFDVASGQPTVTLQGLMTTVFNLWFAPDGRTVAGDDNAGNNCLWDVETGRVILGPDRMSDRFAFSADGKRMLLWRTSRELKRSYVAILETATGRELMRLQDSAPNFAAFDAAAFHPDGRRVVTADASRIRFWDTETGAEMFTLDSARQGWSALAFDQKGERLAALNDLGQVVIWECKEPDAALRQARRRTSIRQRSKRLLWSLRTRGLTREAIARELDRLRAQRREEPEVLNRVQELAQQPDPDAVRHLENMAWEHVRVPGRKKSAEQEVRMMEAAAELAPDDAEILTTLGAALYRSRDYPRALEVLRRAQKAHHRDKRHRHRYAVAWALGAMTLHHLGKTKEAQREMGWAAWLLVGSIGSQDAQNIMLEAENLITGRPWPKNADGKTAVSWWAARNRLRAPLLTRNHPWALKGLSSAAWWARKAGDLRRAETGYRKALRGYLRQGARYWSQAAAEYGKLLEVLRRRKQYETQEAMYREMLRHAEKLGGKDSVKVADVHYYFARELRWRGERERAIAVTDQELRIRRKRLSDQTSHLHRTQFGRHLRFQAKTLMDLGRHREAEVCARESYELFRKLYGARSKEVAWSGERLAYALKELGKFEKAAPLLDAAIEVFRSLPRPLDRDLAGTLINRAQYHAEKAEWQQARRLLIECLAIRKRILEKDHWLIYNAMSWLGHAHAKLGDFESAEPLLIEAAEKIQPPKIYAFRKPEAIRRVVVLYEAWEKKEPGKGYGEKAREWGKKKAEAQIETTSGK